MKKFLFVSMMCCLLSQTAAAAPVTRQQARQKAEGFAQRMGMKSGLEEVAGTRGKAAAAGEEELLHVFNLADGGFVIISGDDQTVDVLGYSRKGRFDYDRLPCNMKAFIDGYAEQIRLVRQHGGVRKSPFVASHATIAPMLTCQWHQHSPFNDECPDFFGVGKCVTGCVAVALAQILYHHRSKAVSDVTLAEITAYDCKAECSVNGVEQGRLHVNAVPAGSPIDWANMQDRYDGSASNAARLAVAQLLRYCGAGLRMEYGLNGSSAADITAAAVAKKYFGFRRDATFLFHENMTDEEWDNAIYGELAAGRPVLMGGSNRSNSGHAFVCDGFDASTAMYHFNWGWDDLNGYFYMSDLNPRDEDAGGYNNGQDMLINMEPGDGRPYEEPIVMTTKTLVQEEKTVARYSNGQFLLDYSFMYANGTSDERSFDYGLALYQGEKLVEELVISTINNLPMTTTWGSSGYCGPGEGLLEGTYEIWPVSRAAGASEWLQNEGPFYILAEVGTNSVTLKRMALKKGDVNHDNKVTPADAIMVLYHYFNVAQNGFCVKAADLNLDGAITPADAIEALYLYFGAGNGARASRPLSADVQDPE